MIADTSVWVDYSRGKRTWQVAKLRAAITDRSAMTTDPVRIEVMAFASPAGQVDRIASVVDACEDVMQLHRMDADTGAAIYRGCRRAGETIRSLNDCLIAAIAIRNDVPVLHADRDFDVIARHFPLRIVSE